MTRLWLPALFLLAGCAGPGSVLGPRSGGPADILAVEHRSHDVVAVREALELDGFLPVSTPRSFPYLRGERPSRLRRPPGARSGSASRTYTRLAAGPGARPVRIVVAVRTGRVRAASEPGVYTLVIAEEQDEGGAWSRVPLRDPARASLVRSLAAITGTPGSRVVGVTDAAGAFPEPTAGAKD